MHDLAGVDPSAFDDIYTDIARKLLSAQLETGQIHEGLYKETAGQLMDAINGGLGGASFEYEDSRNVLRSSLMRNIYQFSAAKSLVELEQFRGMMLDSDGAVKPFYKFRQSIVATGKRFNDTYLRTEYDTAKQSAIMAHRWQSLQAEYLEYNTVGDTRVRADHEVLDGKTYPKEHSFWDKFYPPLNWNCRCTVIPGLARNDNSGGDFKFTKQVDVPEHFSKNVGRTQAVFDTSHPYFVNAKGATSDLTWKEYGLRSEEKIRQSPDTPDLHPSTKEQYLDKWAGMPKHAGDDIVIKDPLGQNVLLDSWETTKAKQSKEYFKDHIFNKEDRSAFASEFDTIIKSPDEIWNDGKESFYIKFYKDKTVAIAVNKQLIADSMYDLTKARSGQVRAGTLLYRR